MTTGGTHLIYLFGRLSLHNYLWPYGHGSPKCARESPRGIRSSERVIDRIGDIQQLRVLNDHKVAPLCRARLLTGSGYPLDLVAFFELGRAAVAETAVQPSAVVRADVLHNGRAGGCPGGRRR